MFTLVPSNFFDPASARETLAEVAEYHEGEEIRHTEIPEYNAVLIYSCDGGSVDASPLMADILHMLPSLREYNKILCTIEDGVLYMAIAQGGSLLLANYYRVPDFTTAEYYIFLALKNLQLNPELSTISWKGMLDTTDEMSLYRYFKSVEQV